MMSSSKSSGRINRKNEWHRRIARAEELGSQYTFAAEILRFYVCIARFQQELAGEIERMDVPLVRDASGVEVFGRELPRELTRQFKQFLSVAEESGPEPLRKAARELCDVGEGLQLQLLNSFWNAASGALPPGPNDFFARGFLQPYAEFMRLRSASGPTSFSTSNLHGPTAFGCPFCERKPGLGVLRPLGDGGQRSLICSFCLGEWEFRRILCPGCGEENHAKLPVYTAEELKHVRVEACDRCRSYIKTVDMTKSGRAEPVVDEMASIPLDLWAAKQGYTKLHVNLMQL